jgi:hypothetical protein
MRIYFHTFSQGHAFSSGCGCHGLPARGALKDSDDGRVDGHGIGLRKL